jgi:hypothetical protein
MDVRFAVILLPSIGKADQGLEPATFTGVGEHAVTQLLRHIISDLKDSRDAAVVFAMLRSPDHLPVFEGFHAVVFRRYLGDQAALFGLQLRGCHNGSPAIGLKAQMIL